MTYNENNGFVSSIWGPQLWFTLHCISFNYPIKPTPTDKQNYRTFFESLQYVLPCGACRTNFAENLKCIDYDPAKHFESRLMFSFLIYSLHRNVRKRQNKLSITYSKCVRLFERFRATDCTKGSDSVEGSCKNDMSLKCTMLVEPVENEDDENTCRYTVDPLCGILFD
jgi:hypothetical protein